ncbi:MAG: hypothetical protein IJ097_04075 [Bacilli bacterium]|nr:hypothetical protein [Bacilli bacterium]
MYIKVNNKTIKIKDCIKFKDRFKSLKFVLEKIDYGIRIPKTKLISTYFFCQKVDICVTDKNNNIIALFDNVNSEKKKFMFKAYYVYYLPVNTIKYLENKNQLIPTKKKN